MFAKHKNIISLTILALFICVIAFANQALAGNGGGKGGNGFERSQEEQAILLQVFASQHRGMTNPNQ